MNDAEIYLPILVFTKKREICHSMSDFYVLSRLDIFGGCSELPMTWSLSPYLCKDAYDQKEGCFVCGFQHISKYLLNFYLAPEK